jgi:hypothetical protein
MWGRIKHLWRSTLAPSGRDRYASVEDGALLPVSEDQDDTQPVDLDEVTAAAEDAERTAWEEQLLPLVPAALAVGQSYAGLLQQVYGIEGARTSAPSRVAALPLDGSGSGAYLVDATLHHRLAQVLHDHPPAGSDSEDVSEFCFAALQGTVLIQSPASVGHAQAAAGVSPANWRVLARDSSAFMQRVLRALELARIDQTTVPIDVLGDGLNFMPVPPRVVTFLCAHLPGFDAAAAAQEAWLSLPLWAYIAAAACAVPGSGLSPPISRAVVAAAPHAQQVVIQ